MAISASETKMGGLSFSAGPTYPNPANTWTSFYYNIPTISDNATLRIINLKGQAVAEFSVKKSTGQLLWDTRKITPGLYLFSLTNGKYSASGKIEIIH